MFIGIDFGEIIKPSGFVEGAVAIRPDAQFIENGRVRLAVPPRFLAVALLAQIARYRIGRRDKARDGIFTPRRKFILGGQYVGVRAWEGSHSDGHEPIDVAGWVHDPLNIA